MSFRYLTAGESHGKALVGILEGIPAGLPITAEEIHSELRRRKQGHGRGARQQIEDDHVEILSGVRHGYTLGSPISLLIRNRDWDNWQQIMQAEAPANSETKLARRLEVPRPGHADYVGGKKYGHEDMRNVLERASARETAMRVALGSVARKLLKELGIEITSRVLEIGGVQDDGSPEAQKRITAAIDSAKDAGDTLGGVFEVKALGLPLGLGSHVQWDRRLEGAIAQAFASLNAIKGVEFGMGFAAAKIPGSAAHDGYFPAADQSIATPTNHSGGLDGGMTTGQPLVVRAAMKPLATLMNALPSVNLITGQAQAAHVERSDVCAVPSAAVIGESLLALVLGEAILEKFGGDSLSELRERVELWKRKAPGIRSK